MKAKDVYVVVEGRNVGLMGKPRFVTTEVFEGTKTACVEFENALRKTYKDRTMVDCWTQKKGSENQYDLYNSLTPEEKQDIIEVDGKRYIRKMYEANNKMKG